MFKDVNRAATVWATHLTLKETIYPQVNSSINRDIITSQVGGWKLYKAAAKIAPQPPELNDHDFSKPPNMSGSEGGDHV